jgi:F-type H+-transporting ATPase subunit b
MLIDWFTVGAQALNFLLLVWLLKHFLYKPILHAIDEREKKIAAELADADSKRTEAKKEKDDFQHKNEEFDRQRTELMSNATNDAKTEREKLIAEATKAADAFSEKRLASLRKEEANLRESIIKKVQQGVFSISRKVLKDLAESDLDERIVNVFIRQLKESSFTHSKMPVTVYTAFSMSSTLQTSVKKQMQEMFGADAQIEFQTNPNLMSGIEITSNGQKVAWSIESYLIALEKNVDEMTKKKEKKVEPKVEEKKTEVKPGAS